MCFSFSMQKEDANVNVHMMTVQTYMKGENHSHNCASLQLYSVNVTFKESQFTRKPYWQCLCTAILVTQKPTHIYWGNAETPIYWGSFGH